MDELNKKVLLLAILKKKEEESLNDVVLVLHNTGVFSLKEGKQILKELKNEGLVANGSLTFSGQIKAQSVELEFTLH